MTDAVLVAIVAAVPSTLAAVLGLVNRRKIGDVQVSVDGRLSELLALTAKSSRAEGQKDTKDSNDVDLSTK
jgi:hypothetical protein